MEIHTLNLGVNPNYEGKNSIGTEGCKLLVLGLWSHLHILNMSIGFNILDTNFIGDEGFKCLNERSWLVL